MQGNFWIAFGMTLIAGLSTGIGSIIAFFTKKDSKRFLAITLGFSAGVMIYVSMIEIFAKAQVSLRAALGDKVGTLATVCGFFGGILLIALIDKLVPAKENPHEIKSLEENPDKKSDSRSDSATKDQLMRTGLFTALVLGIHNFPEGLATFVSAMQEPKMAIPIVVAIAIHNIPEGIAVSVPIFYATGSRKKALFYSFISGMAEPVGALVGYLILMPFMNDVVYGILFAAVAGIMVFISLDELLPSAQAYGEHHLSIYGLIAGMAVMAISLLLFV